MEPIAIDLPANVSESVPVSCPPVTLSSGTAEACATAGTVSGDLFVRKLDSDGQELWTRQLGSPGVDRVEVDCCGVC